MEKQPENTSVLHLEKVSSSPDSISIPVEIDAKLTKKFRAHKLEDPYPATGLNSLTTKPIRGLPRKYLTTGKKIKVRAMMKARMDKKLICELEKISSDQYDLIMDDPALDIMDNVVNEETKKMLGSSFLQLSDLALQQATRPDKLEKMNAFQTTIIAATAYDKFRLSENLSTQNISVQGIVAHLQNEKEELRKARETLLESLSEG